MPVFEKLIKSVIKISDNFQDNFDYKHRYKYESSLLTQTEISMGPLKFQLSFSELFFYLRREEKIFKDLCGFGLSEFDTLFNKLSPEVIKKKRTPLQKKLCPHMECFFLKLFTMQHDNPCSSEKILGFKSIQIIEPCTIQFSECTDYLLHELQPKNKNMDDNYLSYCIKGVISQIQKHYTGVFEKLRKYIENGAKARSKHIKDIETNFSNVNPHKSFTKLSTESNMRIPINKVRNTSICDSKCIEVDIDGSPNRCSKMMKFSDYEQSSNADSILVTELKTSNSELSQNRIPYISSNRVLEKIDTEDPSSMVQFTGITYIKDKHKGKHK